MAKSTRSVVELPPALLEKCIAIALADIIGGTVFGSGDAWNAIEQGRKRFDANDLALLQELNRAR